MRERVQQLINRLLEGKASVAEEQLMAEWLDNIATDQPFPGAQLSPAEKEKLRRQLLNGIRLKTGQKKTGIVWMRTGIAAAVISVIFAGYLALRYFRAAEQPVYQAISTGVGEKKMIALADSTHIWLAPNTTLRYPEKYLNYRSVQLVAGEAFFDISRSAEKHFTVTSNDILIEVLGTSFNIRAYQQLPVWQIAVNSGKVKISRNDQQLGLVSSGQQIQINRDNNNVIHSTADANAGGWMQNRILFENTPLSEALHMLENYYPVHFTLQHKDALQISGALNTSLRLEQVMAVLEELTSHHITFKQQTHTNYIVQ